MNLREEILFSAVVLTLSILDIIYDIIWFKYFLKIYLNNFRPFINKNCKSCPYIWVEMKVFIFKVANYIWLYD
jgi:hypothetical protein